ncbi:MAG: glycoside hydrolase domain-containing protein, partial [Ginsengibacter sp.]
MKRAFMCICLSFFMLSGLQAQDVSLALQKKPVLNPGVELAQWNSMKNNVQVSFANSNTRYARDIFPAINQQNNFTLTAWKGEKIHTQIIVWGKMGIASVRVSASDLKDGKGHIIPKKNVSAGFVGYVMTDEFKDGCGYRKPENFDSSIVADPINTTALSVAFKKNTVQPVWVSINVPANMEAGNYTGIIMVNADKIYKLKLSVKVLNKTLPPPSQWKFNLDFWQHPAA